jgi:hypothetical protein
MAIIGALGAVISAFLWPKGRAAGASVGWLGLVVGGVILQFGPRTGLQLAPVPVALGMAGSAALAVVPVARVHRTVRLAATLAAGLVGVGMAGAALWFSSSHPPAPWPSGSLLVGAHWSALAASLTAGVAGAGMALDWGLRAWRGAEEPETIELVRAHARDFSLRSAALVALAWPLAELIHWRFLGVPGWTSRSEWFGLAVVLLAAGGLMIGWSLEKEPAARIRSALAPIWVALVVGAGIWLSFGFGSPLQLTLGS